MAEPPPLRADPSLRAERSERTQPAAPRGQMRRAQRGKRPGRNSGRRFLRRAVQLAVLLGLWVAIIGGAALGYFALTLPDTSQLTIAERRPSVTVLAQDGSLLATFGDLFGQPLTLKEMSAF